MTWARMCCERPPERTYCPFKEKTGSVESWKHVYQIVFCFRWRALLLTLLIVLFSLFCVKILLCTTKCDTGNSNRLWWDKKPYVDIQYAHRLILPCPIFSLMFNVFFFIIFSRYLTLWWVKNLMCRRVTHYWNGLENQHQNIPVFECRTSRHLGEMVWHSTQLYTEIGKK